MLLTYSLSTWGTPVIFTDPQAFSQADAITQSVDLSNPSYVDPGHFGSPNGLGGVVAGCWPQTPYIPDPCILITPGVTFVATLGRISKYRPELTIYSPGLALPGAPWNIQSNLGAISPDDFYMQTASNAIGFNVWTGTIFPTGQYAVQVVETGGSMQITTFTLTYSTSPQFVGVYDSAGIESVSVYSPGSNFILSDVQFQPSVPVYLSDLKKETKGLGPGKSLHDKVTLVEAYYDANDLGNACLLLDGFNHEINAQAGKSIDSIQMMRLTSDSTWIQSALNCASDSKAPHQ